MSELGAQNMSEPFQQTGREGRPGQPHHSVEKHTPVDLPWQSKPTLPTEDPSLPSEEEEVEEDVEIDEQLKVVWESLRELYRESEELCRRVFSKFHHEHLLEKKNEEGPSESNRKAFVKLGNKKISRILKQEVKWNEEKAGMMQRSLSFDSPRTPPQRFKVKTPELVLGGGGGGGGGGGLGGPQDVIKGSSTKAR